MWEQNSLILTIIGLNITSCLNMSLLALSIHYECYSAHYMEIIWYPWPKHLQGRSYGSDTIPKIALLPETKGLFWFISVSARSPADASKGLPKPQNDSKSLPQIGTHFQGESKQAPLSLAPVQSWEPCALRRMLCFQFPWWVGTHQFGNHRNLYSITQVKIWCRWN